MSSPANTVIKSLKSARDVTHLMYYNSINPTSCVFTWLTLSPYLRELCGNPRSVTGVRVVFPKVLPRTLSRRDDSITSLTKSFLRLMPPLGHLKHDVLKHFLYHILYYTTCTQTSLNLIFSLFTGRKLLTLTFLKNCLYK